MEQQPTPARVRMTNGSGSGGRRLRQLLHKENDDVLRSHTLMTVKLAETAGDFFQKMAQAEELYLQQLMNIVKTFRRKTTELKKERDWLPSSFGFWDDVLNEVEKTAGECGSFAGELSSLVVPTLSDISQKKKAQIKRLFTSKDQLSGRLDKLEDQAHKSYKDYQEKWTKFTAPEDQSLLKGSQILQCYNAHNSYLFAIQAYNSRCEVQYKTTLPELLDDVQDLQNEVVNGLKAAFRQHLESNHGRLQAAQERCAALARSVERVDCDSDVSEFVAAASKSDEFWPPLIVYAAPEQSEKCFDDRLLVKTLTQAPLIHLQETLTEDEQKMKELIEKDEKELSSLIGLCQSYVDTPSYGDYSAVESQVVELKVRLRAKRLDLAAISGKLSLYERVNVSAALTDTLPSLPSNGVDTRRGRGFKGRPPSLVAGPEHNWVQLQYKIPLPCGYCGGLLKEVHKQGLKCKECKMAIHHKCKKHVPFCSGLREIDRGTLARPRVGSIPGSPKAQREKRFSVTGLPSAYEVPKWMANMEEYSPPVPPRRTSAAQLQEAVSDTPPPLPVRTVSKHSDPVGIYEDRISPPGWKPRSPPPTSGPLQCVALYEYYASSDGDLALSPGDVINLVNTGESGWWQGTCHGETGFFPASYAQMLAPGDVIMRVLYDFSAEGKGELSLYEGQIVVMKEKRGDGWMFGRSGNEHGLFPSSYVELVKER